MGFLHGGRSRLVIASFTKSQSPSPPYLHSTRQLVIKPWKWSYLYKWIECESGERTDQLSWYHLPSIYTHI